MNIFTGGLDRGHPFEAMGEMSFLAQVILVRFDLTLVGDSA
jgi:hypothetical protein